MKPSKFAVDNAWSCRQSQQLSQHCDCTDTKSSKSMNMLPCVRVVNNAESTLISFFTGFGDNDYATHTSAACSWRPSSAWSPATPPALSPGPWSPPTPGPQPRSEVGEQRRGETPK